jgi:hypothetical protein
LRRAYALLIPLFHQKKYCDLRARIKQGVFKTAISFLAKSDE